MISVILCAYNEERYIERAIKSVLDQTYKEIELIVVDDGSRDKTAEIVRHYIDLDKRIKYFYIENSGLGKARSVGISHAKGEWISIIDADDWFDDNWLEKLSKYIAVNVDIIIGNAYMCFQKEMNIEKRERISFSRNYVFEGRQACDFLVANAIAARINQGSEIDVVSLRSIGIVWDKLYRKSFLDSYNIDFQEVRISEDLRFTTECFSKCKKVIYCDAIGYNYLVRDDSLSKGKDMNYVLANQKTMEYYLESLNQEAKIIGQAISVAQLRFFLMDMQQYFRRRDIDQLVRVTHILELIHSITFQTAIEGLEINENNLSEEEKYFGNLLLEKNEKELLDKVFIFESKMF